jgi:hypothetical protein
MFTENSLRRYRSKHLGWSSDRLILQRAAPGTGFHRSVGRFFFAHDVSGMRTCL